MSHLKILCYVVAYNAEAFIGRLLSAIPGSCWHNPRYAFDVLISDDCSTDDTYAACERAIAASSHSITLQRTGHNLGYGGNQKLGYDYAVKHGYDAVVLLHGDGQYDPAYIPQLLEPILAGDADVVLGSRMLRKRDALKGGMPLYKFVGNIVLTGFQNYLLGSRISEFHTGFRAYGVKALANIPYRYNSDGYSFDTDILLQHRGAGYRIAEIAIPTHYGEEKCHVNGMRYAWRVVLATLAFKMHQLGFSYQRKYDDGRGHYPSKIDFDSSHSFALRQAAGAKLVADIGGSSGHVARALRRQGKIVHGFDIRAPDGDTREHYDRYTQVNIDECADWTVYGIKPDTVLLLDIVEHLREPEIFLYRLRDILDEHTRVIITVPNFAFFTVRLKLLFGVFSYGSRGILDHTHLRFFTFRSVKAMLKRQGFAIVEARGIPAPFPLVIKSKGLAGALLKLNAALIGLSRGLFSFQIAIIAEPKAISHDS